MDRRIRQRTNIHESQFGFMPCRSTTEDAIFILKQTIEKHREGQKKHTTPYPGRRFGDAHGNESAGKVHYRLVQDMYQGCKTV